uniref:Uncharacterized protein n=1 Tax=Cannabis sativa TaxID=3483 RepID=A0A803QHU1_CANSA
MPSVTTCCSTTQPIINFSSGFGCHAQGPVDQENINPNRRVKRQKESKSLRQTLKRCRGNQGFETSFLSVEVDTQLSVSDDAMQSRSSS